MGKKCNLSPQEKERRRQNRFQVRKQEILDTVDRSNCKTCWIWPKRLDEDGYGQVGYMGKHQRVHRLFYLFLVGAIPDGLQIDHLCRNRACVNPAHLEIVPQKVNLLRGEGICAKNARKTHCKRGHEFTTENTRFYNSPKWGVLRVCKMCENRPERLARQLEREKVIRARRKALGLISHGPKVN